MGTKPQRMTVTEFKAKCLRLVEDLHPDGIVLTKRGRPVARVLPAESRSNRDLVGVLKGRIVVKGDLLSTGARWHAQS
jgi:prevent-host-death family protein